METLTPVEPWRDREILTQRSGEHYITLPFHGCEHPLDVRDEALSLAQQYLAEGGDPNEIDFDVLESAALWHDARVYLPISWHGFESKEKFSMYIYMMDMRSLGMPEEKIAKGARLIEITERGTHCETVMERIFRRADLKNVSAKNPLNVIRNTVALNHEIGILSVLEEMMQGQTYKDLSPQEILDLIYADPKTFDYRSRRPNLINFGKGSYELLNDLVAEDLSVPGCPDFNTPCSKNLPWLRIPERLILAARQLGEQPDKAA
jgi:hypothetical protein